MIDLTVIILTKNEERNIEKCIKSFCGVAKRFVVVDSGSTDNTKDICDKINHELNIVGSKLDFYYNKWSTYATQFNWGLENTDIDTNWVMRMDADEELLPELVKEMEKKIPSIEKDEDINGIVLRRRVYFMGKWIKHGGRYPEKLLRIFRRGTGLCEERLMDEHLILNSGKIVEFSSDFKDNNQKNLEWWTNKHNWYSNREVLDYQLSFLDKEKVDNRIEKQSCSSTQAKMKRKVKNKGYYRLPKFFRAHIYFIYRYYIKLGFLDGPEGRIFHFLQAYWYRFLVDAKLYECEKKGIKMKEQGELNA